MGRHVGVILAAVLLTLLPEGLRELGSRSIPNFFGGPEWSLAWIKDIRMILYSLLLITLMLTRPQGLFTWPLWKKKTA
jgi:branched-chain amino acid transport system permease protein